MTILFSTHILADADEVCDEVLLLHKGSIVESGEMDELRQKYKSSKIELVFTGEDTDMDERLKKLKTVVDVSKIRNTFHVSITNTEDAKQEILSTAANENWYSGFF